MSQIPGAMRKVRAVADWTVGLPFSRDIAEVGSIGHPRPLTADVQESEDRGTASPFGPEAISSLEVAGSGVPEHSGESPWT